MTPVTCFEGKHAAVFGLGGSGFVTAQALVAGGARVSVWDDNEHAREKARAAGLRIENLATADWRNFDSLVLSPGVPLTHPAPHWTVLEGKASRDRSHRRHRIILPRATENCARLSLRGDHRDERKVHNHSARRASLTRVSDLRLKSAAISARPSSRWNRRRKNASTSSNAHPFKSILRHRSIRPPACF